MRYRSIFHHIQFILIICVVLSMGVIAGGVYYLNETGINERWRERISTELENIGIVADFESLHIDIRRGLIATGVQVYADNRRSDVIATLEHLVIDVDKTKLMRGKVRVISVALKQADISLPVDPEQPDGARITLSKLDGEMYLPDKKTLEAREIEGVFAGIRISLDGRIWSEQIDSSKDPDLMLEKRSARLKFIERIAKETRQWRWPENSAPTLKLYVEGSTDKPDTARIDFIFEAPEIERRGITLRDIHIKGDYNNHVLTLDTISLRDSVGDIKANASYRPAMKVARFEAQSTLHIQRLSRQLFGTELMSQLTFSSPPSIDCTGTINFKPKPTPDILITGHTTLKNFSFLGSRFTNLTTDFSSRGRDFFLTGLHAIHQQGELKGRILMKDRIVRYEASSSLPASSYMPFLSNSGVAKTLQKASFKPSSKVNITAKGTMNRGNLTQWEAEGHASFEDFTYQDTAMNSLSGNYFMNELGSRFTGIKANFDYNDYYLKRSYGGPSSASVSADSIAMDRIKKTIAIENIAGIAWPAPIVRLFVPKTADHVEKYRFHRPPNLAASGTFDLEKSREKTDFTINLSHAGSMHYEFINEPLTLDRVKAKVQIFGDRVAVDNLSFSCFQGQCDGDIKVFFAGAQTPYYQGLLKFLRFHLKDIGETYKFNNAERGLLTGRIEFKGEGSKMSKFNGSGSLALEKGNLFSVPMLGPISQLIGGVLGERNPTAETAKDASCTYIIRDGVVYSNDFLATTRSLKFTGEGSIDLNKKEIDMLVRMNARGLFGFIALPLRPFMGLFQFKGSGPITKPNWKTSVFTNPDKGKDDPIFGKPPPKATIIGE